MNNDLIKRIDDFLVEFGLSTKEWDLLNECRAEIERLNTVLEVTDENHGRTTVLAHKALKELDKAKAEIERLSQVNERLRNQNTALDEILAEYSERKYVPMTDDELSIMMAEWYDDEEALPITQHIEATVIKRAGLEIKHD